jgi:Cu(I)/Ag(I) efflux system membrane protein CusA/SilA
MIERIIEWSIRNRFLVLIVAAALSIAGVFAVFRTPMDAIPDLSENQVIVFADWMGRSPREIEDQVTYPLSRKLQGLAGVKAVRSSSEFNFSMITIIFEDGIDFYFARQRVTEKLAQANTFLPAGVVPYLAPDATALGQVFWYTVEASSRHPIEPGRLWALNKFYVAPQLNAAPGVSDVAVVGGMPLEYQIDVRPEELRSFNLTIGDLYSAVARSNMPAGGGVIQKNNAEYIVRGVGWIRDKGDIENTVIREVNGTPLYVKSVATVQLGTQFRRSVYEKNGNEVTGGTVLMRHGQNPLTVTQAVKDKIVELQPGLPEGVHIVPAYDRTRLIHGAIHTLTEVMWHEMLIASIAILLILVHVRSVLVICVTLPLAVLSSFLLMWMLRVTGIIDIQANIMSLAGITISIGILVDQAIVMVENATHHLKEHFGDRRVSGDTSELVIPACRTVGRPIFFSVMIMLISFIPVFMLSGREGKLFHPLAFTKSFALLGVALISITLVPALIPAFVRGRLRSEEENWIVNSFIQIYKPLLTWALPRRNLVMWFFAAMLILAAGMFPLQAVMGQGASETAWKTSFLTVFALVTALTVIATRGWYWQAISFVTLLLLSFWAYHFPKIGVSFMPPLDEGVTLDMPVTVPRVSVTQSADDLKARDALLRGFPEVESVIGKAGRADTPTDPAPLDMVETFVNFRPKEFWPKRVLRYPDAAWQVERVLNRLVSDGFVVAPQPEDERRNLVNDATQKAMERFDETLRELALRRYSEFEHELQSRLTVFGVEETMRLIRQGMKVKLAPARADQEALARLANDLTPQFGPWLAGQPALEDAAGLTEELVKTLKARKAIPQDADALALHESGLGAALSIVSESLSLRRKTLATELLAAIQRHRDELWREHVRQVNWELFDRGVESFTWYAIEETVRAADGASLLNRATHRVGAERFAKASLNVQLNKPADESAFEPFHALRDELEEPMRKKVFLWPRRTGPKGDLVDDEMSRVLQVPGWSNIFTQPIINRIEMLSTGVRTDIGVKVFGPDLETVDRVCKEVEKAVKPINGARDTIAAPIMGKGYVDIQIKREEAARYGISIEDIQNEIEIALAGKAVTFTVEKRDRFPVRIRYARASREDEESIRRLLISPQEMSLAAGGMNLSGIGSPSTGSAMGRGGRKRGGELLSTTQVSTTHGASSPHAANQQPLIPLSAVADVRIVEGPAMIKSENGRLLNYVTLNVRGRDIVGFVDEAKRAVAQKVVLPEGVSIAWSGEFEHQVRAAQTLRFVFPAVVVLIFVILYLTYHDLADASLMMLAVPEALAGGAFFMYLFPKIIQGWDAPPMDFSVAVWVGFIACFGMATETGIIMLVYLREAIEKRGGLENMQSLEELRQAVIEGAVHRLRPKLLTEGVAIIAIFPMVFAKGVGGEILAPMALPVLGGLLISDEVVDLFLPVRFYWVRRARWLKLQAERMRGQQPAPAQAFDEPVLAESASNNGELSLSEKDTPTCPLVSLDATYDAL